jgi:hypothetical protein
MGRRVFSIHEHRALKAGVRFCCAAAVVAMAWTAASVTPNDEFVWARGLGGSGADQGRAITTDSTGHVYATGSFSGSANFDPGATNTTLVAAGQEDIFVQKRNPDGSLAWVRSMGGSQTDIGFAIAVDDEGNVYTTGYFQGVSNFDPGVTDATLVSGVERDIFVQKHDPDGELVWVRSMGGPNVQSGLAIAVGNNGGVYTAGLFAGTVDFNPSDSATFLRTAVGTFDLFVSKLNANGDFEWAWSTGGPGIDQATGITVDDQGDVYATGFFRGNIDFNPSTTETFLLNSQDTRAVFVTKLNSNGGLIWARVMGGTSPTQAEGAGIAVDGAGNVFTTGWFNGPVDFDPSIVTSFVVNSAGGQDIFVSKLNVNGEFAWVRTMGGAGNNRGGDVALDAAGNAYTTGVFRSTADFNPHPVDEFELTAAGGDDIFVSKLTADGDFVWAHAFGDTGNDVGSSIAVDAARNVLVTGWFRDTVDFDSDPVDTAELTSAGGDDIFILKLGDTTPPNAIAVTPATLGPVNDTSIDFTVEFDEPVMGFDSVGDLLITHSNTANTGVTITGGPTIFTATVEGLSGDGSFTVAVDLAGSVTDLAGNALASSVTSDPVVIDTVPPDISIGPPSEAITGVGPVTYIVSYTDADAITLSPADVVLNASGAVNAIIGVSGAGNDRTVTLSSITGDGSLGISILPGTASDSLGNLAEAAGPSAVFTVDNNPPNAISITPATTGPTNAPNIGFEVVFDQPVEDFDDAADLIISHTGTANTGVTIVGGPVTYTATVEGISGNGSFTVAVNTASNVIDLAGNSLQSSVTSAPVIIDTTPPVITLNGDAAITIEFGDPYDELGATAVDNLDGNISGQIVVTGSVNTNALGVYQVFYNVSDSAGNAAAQVVRTITVVDTTPPVITLLGDAAITIEAGDSFDDPGAMASDNVDGDISGDIVVTGSVNTNELGVYQLFYNVSDSSGNAATQVVRTVTVEDTTPPVITLLGDAAITVEAGDSFDDPGATALDNIDGDISGDIVVTGSVNTNELGTYQLFYNVSDSSGNAAAQAVRTVTVEDTTPPVITLLGDATIEVIIGSAFDDPGATALDSFEGDLTADIQVDGTVDTNTLGTYELTYTVSDSSGNEAEAVVRVVEVIESANFEDDVVIVLTGQLRDAVTGDPLSCGVVELTGSSGEFRVAAVADANGVYFFEPQPTDLYSVRVMAPGYAALLPDALALEDVDEGETAEPIEQDFELAASASQNTVNGLVTDEDTGEPLVGVLVQLFIGGVDVADTFSCANGRYEVVIPEQFGGVAALDVEVRFSLPNFFPKEREEEVDPAVGIVVDETLKARFDGPSAIIGSVMATTGDKASEPLANARVTLRGPINTSTLTDGAGLYSFDAILNGSYSVTASAPGFGGKSRQRGLDPGTVGEVSFELNPLPDTSEPGVPGDVNGDGVVNAVDVQLVINAALGLSINPAFNADINSDGVVNAVDVQLVINAALGIDISGQV